MVILFAAEVVYLLGVEAAEGIDGLDEGDLMERFEQDQLLLGLQILARLQFKQSVGEGLSLQDLQIELRLSNKTPLLKLSTLNQMKTVA